MIKEKFKNNIYYIVLGLTILAGILLRLKGYLINPSMWHDECAIGWNIINKHYLELFKELRFLQIAPPFFSILSKITVKIFGGYSHLYLCDMALRTMSIVASIFSIGMFFVVSKKMLNSRWSVICALIIFAINPMLISYSYEAKPYSFEILFSLIAIYLFLIINYEKMDYKKLFCIGLILSICPWFALASAFVIFAGMLSICFTKKEYFKKYLIILLPLVISGITYLNVFIANAYSKNENGMVTSWVGYFVEHDLSNLLQLIISNLQFFFMHIPYLPILFVIIFAISGLILLLKDKKFLFVSITFLSNLIVTVASIFHFYPYCKRMVLFLLPFLIIYIVKITDIKKWLVGWLLILFLIVPNLIFTNSYIHLKTFNKGDFARDMMIIMSKNITPTETIVISEGSNADYFYYNYFFKLNNHIEYLKPNKKAGETYPDLLKQLKKGSYWFFLPYDYSGEFVNIKEISAWAKNNTLILFEAHATQSTLIHLIID